MVHSVTPCHPLVSLTQFFMLVKETNGLSLTLKCAWRKKSPNAGTGVPSTVTMGRKGSKCALE